MERRSPSRLARKLLAIRARVGLSQGGLIRHLGLDGQIERDYISKFERGILEPTLDVLLAYARSITTTGRGEFLEAIIDDKLDQPDRLPPEPQSHKFRGKYARRITSELWM